MDREEQESGNGRQRERLNICMDPAIRALGEALGEEDHRSLSQEITWLIDQEHKRRQTQPVPNQAA